MSSLQYLLHQQIDKAKWDACINKSINRLIYAQSFYLDAMTTNWDAIVLNDYEAVMPLPWKRKWGITYLYQPPFIQQGGIFFTTAITPEIVKRFAAIAFGHFKFAEITFNYQNDISSIENCTSNMRNNYVMPLNNSYQEIYASYHTSITKDLKK